MHVALPTRPELPPARAGVARRAHVVELVIVLSLVVPGNLVAWLAKSRSDVGFPLAAASTIVHDVALTSLVLFLVWRAGEPPAEIGWRTTRTRADVLTGIALFAPLWYGAEWLHHALRSAGLSGAARRPAFLLEQGPAEAALGTLMVVVVAIGEETLFRGYLLSRLRAAGLGRAAAVVVASTVFALGHGYEGAAGMITVGTMGALYSVLYLWRGSLVAPIVAHFLHDLFAIVLSRAS